MTDDASLPRSSLQRALLWLYRCLRQTPLLRSRWGRRAFEEAYLAYKFVEAGPIAQLKPYVAADSWVIDVGANIGMFTGRFVEWTGLGGRVIAIEPEAANFASLTRRLSAPVDQKRLIAVEAVAAEESGQLRLEINPDHPGDHRIGPGGVPIQAVTLDELLAQHGDPPVSLIKIDVQGAELRVLRGATAVLRRCHPALFIEVDDLAMQKQAASATELLDFLGTFGYRPYRLSRFGPPEPVAAHGLGVSGYEDVLFLGHSGSQNR